MRVDLITGFLGSGKTTFIRKYLSWLQEKGERIRIIENEFGAVNVDTRLLQDITQEIDDLAGCCMCCTGKDRFISMLLEAAAGGYDRVLVEPSGIYDVDEFFSVMRLEKVAQVCEIGSILTIVDACLPQMPSGETGYLMYAQLLAAGEIILSKTQLAGRGTGDGSLSYAAGTHPTGTHPTETHATDGHAAETYAAGTHTADGHAVEAEQAQTERVLQWMQDLVHSIDPEQTLNTPVCTKHWDDFTPEDYRRFESCGFYHGRHNRKLFDHGAAYATFMTVGNFYDEKDLERRLHKVFEDPEHGEILRIKGFMRDPGKNWYEVNCTRHDFQIRPVTIRRGLAVVIGQKLNEAKLKETLES